MAPAPRAPPGSRAKASAPASGCVIEREQRLGTGSRGVALRDGVLVAADDALTLWSLAATWREGPRLSLDAPLAKATAHCGDGGCQLAFVDQRSRLFYAAVDGALPAPQELARGADRRFAPALATSAEQVLIAYTATVDQVMHTKLLALRGGVLTSTLDVTPEGHGAAAPTFLLGASSPTLIALDARAGISPLLELPLDASGKPQQAWVRTPVSQPFEPPQLAALVWPGGEAEVFFTVIGRLAMTAIGRVPLRRAEAIAALSPSRGYGLLEFALARGERRALFACEVPDASTPRAARRLELTLGDGARYDVVAELDARAPSLARVDSGYLLAFTRAGEVYAALLRCAD
jgi:hypothetical protein